MLGNGCIVFLTAASCSEGSVYIGLQILSYFYFTNKKVRSWPIFFGRPSGLSARLKFKSPKTTLSFVNFENLKIICKTNSTVPNKMALFEMQK